MAIRHLCRDGKYREHKFANFNFDEVFTVSNPEPPYSVTVEPPTDDAGRTGLSKVTLEFTKKLTAMELAKIGLKVQALWAEEGW